MRFVITEELLPGMVVGRDIISPNQSFMIKEGVALTEDAISYLTEKGYLGAYIFDAGSSDLEIQEVISEMTLAEGVKAVAENDIGKLMSSARQIVTDISNLEKLSIDLFDMRSFDDYTYHHSVNVAVYAAAVGKYMGMEEDELIELAQAGICHDLGKQKIPAEIINKPGQLSDEEFELIKKHPQYAYDMLYDNHEIPAVVRQAVLCHHENENGSGYPSGLTGENLSLMAKILHAVDVYDALISRRPYKEPYAPVDAFEYLMGGKNILFDERVVDAMRVVIPAYPIAMEVSLSTGVQAMVVAHSSDPLRPVVKTINAKELLGKEVTLDLSLPEWAHITIMPKSLTNADYTGSVDKLNESRLAGVERKKEIMIVDDSIISLQSTSAVLSKDNYHLITLQSGLAAMNYIREKGAPDLVIMDIEMPTLDGVAAVTAIREMGFTDLPVIFLTSNVYKETVMRCLAVQARDYIVKPARPVYLRERVAVALDASLER